MLKLKHIKMGLCLMLVLSGVIFASNNTPEIKEYLPLWSVIPFALTLLSIAIIPLVLPHWWEKNLNKGIMALIFGLPVIIYIATIHPSELLVTLEDYISFIILLGALYIIAGGIHIKGSLAGTPLINTVLPTIVWVM